MTMDPKWTRMGMAALVLTLASCADRSSPAFPAINELGCSIPEDMIFNGGPGKDGIPALTGPALVAPNDAEAEYLREDDRVIGLDIGGEAVAVPLNILWYHEIVNLNQGGESLAVTHCPLTGSSLVFDRGPLGDVEFGVSGLLYMNNLIMYDRSNEESLWPQMAREARCGSRDGTELVMVPAVEVEWGEWRRLRPNTMVVGSATGHNRNYRRYPYGNYDETSNSSLLFPVPDGIDGRRPPKERVLGIPTSGGGLALPFGELGSAPAKAVVELELEGAPVVVFWESAGAAAMAYDPVVDGTRLTFEVVEGEIVDDQTGTAWRVDGRTNGGALHPRQLRPVPEAHVAYWFAWAAFHPDTDVWIEG